jgi:hypothetical protein
MKQRAKFVVSLAIKKRDMDNHLPKEPFRNLALSLSGGGYRAASFHLGLLTYLGSVKWKDIPLLQRVRILSTVSGGTFTGVCYATTIARKGSLKDCYDRLYRMMTEVDLIREGLKKLSDFKNWKSGKSRSLINAFSLVYYEQFERNTFSFLTDNDSHLKEIIFNSTEFTYGLPFRFQKTTPWNRFAYYGNRQVNMSPDTLKEIRLADIIAASSCFPLGFEPINFPDDFRHDLSPLLNDLIESYKPDKWGKKCRFPVGLMDGGIDDNQGIQSVNLAEKRMHNYGPELSEFRSDDEKAVDLFLISDVASPFMDSYVKTEEKPPKCWRKWSFRTFLWSGLVLGIAGVLSVYLACHSARPLTIFFSGFIASVLFLLSALSFFLSNIFNWLLKKFDVPEFFMKRLGRFTGMKFGIYETLIRNRISSAKSLVAEVFMKQIRRREFDIVYTQPGWDSRLIMNAVYELTPDEVGTRAEEEKDLLSQELKNPGQLIMDTAVKAKSMDTTLWFMPEELEDQGKDQRSMLNTLIACGQFTGCFNLLEYIEKVIWNKNYKAAYDSYPDDLKSEIRELYNHMMNDWQHFNKDPYWMVDDYNKS